mgnify:CR=1 FL=1
MSALLETRDLQLAFGAVVVADRTVRFDFKRVNAELPLMVGGMPVFSRAWGGGKPLDKIITAPVGM